MEHAAPDSTLHSLSKFDSATCDPHPRLHWLWGAKRFEHEDVHLATANTGNDSSLDMKRACAAMLWLWPAAHDSCFVILGWLGVAMPSLWPAAWFLAFDIFRIRNMIPTGLSMTDTKMLLAAAKQMDVGFTLFMIRICKWHYFAALILPDNIAAECLAWLSIRGSQPSLVIQ